MDHSNHIRLAENEITNEIVAGATVYGPEDEKIGQIDHLHGSGPSAQVIIDVGGFLGLGSKAVRVPCSELDLMRDESRTVHARTNWSKAALKDLPEHRH